MRPRDRSHNNRRGKKYRDVERGLENTHEEGDCVLVVDTAQEQPETDSEQEQPMGDAEQQGPMADKEDARRFREALLQHM